MSATALGSRGWVIVGAVSVLAVCLASWFLLISPVLDETEQLRDDTALIETQNVGLEANLAELAAAPRGKLARQVRSRLAALPAEVDLPDFNRQILGQARARGVDVVNLSVGSASAPVQDSTSTPDPTEPATGPLAVPITLQSRGTALQLLFFLRDIQEIGPRRALLTSAALGIEGEGLDPDAENNRRDDVFVLTTQLMIFTTALTDADRAVLAEVVDADVLGAGADATP